MQPRCRQVPPILSSSTRATLQAELGGAERRRVAAGPGAEDDEIEVIGRADGHGSGCRGVPREPPGQSARGHNGYRARHRGPSGRVGHCQRWYARLRRPRKRRRPARCLTAARSVEPDLVARRCSPNALADPAFAGARLRPRTPNGSASRTAVGAVPLDPALVLRTAVLMLVAYLAGSIPVGVLVARVAGGTDPRTIGSGRTGGTNALRALGRKWAAVVVSGDLLKGALPVLLARVVTGGDPLVEALCAASAIAGAIWSRLCRVPQRAWGGHRASGRCWSFSRWRSSWRHRSLSG